MARVGVWNNQKSSWDWELVVSPEVETYERNVFRENLRKHFIDQETRISTTLSAKKKSFKILLFSFYKFPPLRFGAEH